jgi:hypothetical protein
MKTKEQLAKEYRKTTPNQMYGDELGFLAGFTAAKPKWINVEEQLPDNDRTVLVWINNTENPQWSGYKLGAYLNEKWYCDGGRESHEIVTGWCQIPASKK